MYNWRVLPIGRIAPSHPSPLWLNSPTGGFIRGSPAAKHSRREVADGSAVEVQPAVPLVVVEPAGFQSSKKTGPRPPFMNDIGSIGALDRFLARGQIVQRDHGIRMVSGVLHDFV